MFRDAAYTHLSSGQPFTFCLLKFFQIAFLVAWDEPAGLKYPIHNLERWRSAPINLVADLPLGLSNIPLLFWPEAPTEDSILTYGQEAIHAVA